MNPAKTCRKKFLVIDDQDILEINNLVRKVNQAVKHPEPVLKLDAPWDTEKSDQFNHVNVSYDGSNQLFKMWYAVCGRRPGQYWEQGRKIAYATSQDGIHWEKPVMEMVDVRGSKKNNYIIPEMFDIGGNILIDESDGPARRYKMIFAVDSPEMRWAGFHCPLCLAYSADGIHWDRPVHVNPILRGISDGEYALLYDPDRRRYQLYTRRVPNLPRDISLYESCDLVNWEDLGRVLVAGDEHDPPEMYNLHGLAPFFYDEYCLGLLETMYFQPGAENGTVLQRPPAEWPFKKLGVVDVQLAYSRDGRQWCRPTDRSPVIGVGSVGAPDAGFVMPAKNGPIVINGETWIYYLASRSLHTAWSSQGDLHGGDARDTCSCMLAKMPEDHWVSLDAGNQEGWFLAKPWHMGSELLVNADAKGGSIEVELLTPYGQPMEGCSRTECIPITGNGKDQPVRWKSGRCGWDFIETHQGGMLAKFYLRNAKLYSYTTIEPDPDGWVARYWANARWLEHIKHRSGNWGRNSNEPAKGLPPHGSLPRDAR